MKKATLLFSLLVILLIGCKKEPQPAVNNTPADAFAANDSLVSANANLYIIADVEGLTGVTHINEQDTIWGVTPQWSAGHCTNGDCSYGGGVGDISGNPTWVFKAQYNGTGETHEQLLVQNYTTFITPANEHHGIELVYIATNGKSYYSNLANNPGLTWANIALKEVKATNDPNTPYYVKIHFNCQLKDGSSNATINFKNAVARVKM